jgi:hypothetical protein
MVTMIILLALACLLPVLLSLPRTFLSFPKWCPACGNLIYRYATRCEYCTQALPPVEPKGREHRGKTLQVLLALCLAAPALVHAQGVVILDCPDVRFFGPACEDGSPVLVAPIPPPAPKLAPKDYPLFSKETAAPSTPPLLLEFMNSGTVESALAYLEWHDRKADVMRARQQLLHQLIPTVSPLIIPLLYCHINGFQRAFSAEKPWPGGEKRMAGWAAHPVEW